MSGCACLIAALEDDGRKVREYIGVLDAKLRTWTLYSMWTVAGKRIALKKIPETAVRLNIRPAAQEKQPKPDKPKEPEQIRLI